MYRDDNIIVVGIIYDMGFRINNNDVPVRHNYNNEMYLIPTEDLHGIRAYYIADVGGLNKPMTIVFRYIKE